jgi:hypothetical protein
MILMQALHRVVEVMGWVCEGTAAGGRLRKHGANKLAAPSMQM